MSRKKESGTAPSADSNGRSDFEITHPFHPDRGVRLQLLHTRVAGRERWLWYVDRAGGARQVREDHTDRAEVDAFLRQAAGRCAFRPSDLVRLAVWAERRSRNSR